MDSTVKKSANWKKIAFFQFYLPVWPYWFLVIYLFMELETHCHCNWSLKVFLLLAGFFRLQATASLNTRQNMKILFLTSDFYCTDVC